MSALKSLPTYSADYKYSPKFNNQTRLVLGTSGLGGVWGGVDTGESVDALLYGLEEGIAAFDTAPSYADAEKVLGEALRQWKGQKPFVSTKVGRLRAELPHDYNMDYSSDGMRRSVENSLKTLGLDKVDLLFLHEPQLVESNKIPGILEVLQSFVEEGLVDRLGIGGNLTEAFKPYMGKGKFEVISGFLRMNACNLDVFQGEMDFIKEHDLAYYNASILHYGLLGRRLPMYKENYEKESAWLKKRDIAIAEDLEPLAECKEQPLSMLAQRFVFTIAEADRVVVGAKNKEQIKKSLEDWDRGPVSRSLFDEICEIIASHY